MRHGLSEMIRFRKKRRGLGELREPSETAAMLHFSLAAKENLLGECGVCQALHGQKVSKREV